MATSTHGLSVRGPFSVGARGWQLRIVVLVYYDAISQESHSNVECYICICYFR